MLISSCGLSLPVHGLVVLLVMEGGWLTSLPVIVHWSVFALDFIHFHFTVCLSFGADVVGLALF